MTIRSLGLFVPLFLAAHAVAQTAPNPKGPATREPGQPPPGARHAGGDPVGERLFPPDLLMEHQVALGLTDKQRQAIIAELQRFQSSVVELQWQLAAAGAELAVLLDAPRVAEDKALAAADRVMGHEREVKRAHLGLLIRLKNLLTEDQQMKAKSMRERGHP